ncbi:MAG TPA: flagellar type III secretion system pore protein FliP [Acidimicrobiales bacterium]|jgi:flagellar biosynthetic protein FliP|nr:flagellar type III secretion system pore protein FliP [Acidimicrobiales bacterium]
MLAHILATTTTSTTVPGSGSSININLGSSLSKPSDSILIILALTLLALAPSLLILMTGFTRIIIVFSLLRQALGLTTTPPNQVLAGLALILSLFVMAPTLKTINHDAVQPYLHGSMNSTQAYRAAETPLKSWMLKQTGAQELSLTTGVDGEHPAQPSDASMAAVIPAFVLSQLKSGFEIGFIIFIPFLIIDLVVASVMMSMGIVMLPPTLVSLPFKLLLFVMVNGWILITQSLIVSFH